MHLSNSWIKDSSGPIVEHWMRTVVKFERVRNSGVETAGISLVLVELVEGDSKEV